jgi:hypothetical protein
MPNCSHLPQWVSYFQALGVPLAALIVTLLGVWIAARQMLIADEKVRLDSFNSQYERRFAVYDATRSIFEKSICETISETDLRVYGLRVLEARFLFNDDGKMYTYLGEVQRRIATLWLAKSGIGTESDEETRADYKKIRNDTLEWIRNQGWNDRVGIWRFEPFLKYVVPTRRWLLRWP